MCLGGVEGVLMGCLGGVYRVFGWYLTRKPCQIEVVQVALVLQVRHQRGQQLDVAAHVEVEIKT